jgi:threonine/homoserine/homoserine lactone efflux protein
MEFLMTIETWLAYVAAYTIISLIPGPSVFMVLGQSLSRGLGAASFCILGDLFGGIIVMTASYIGLGVILAASSEAFFLLKWAGVAYMAWLGFGQIKAARRLCEADLAEQSFTGHRSASLRAGFLTGVLNPKAIMFYVAFLAQFMNPAFPMTPQFLILMLTSSVVVFVVLMGYALLATQARRKLTSLRARKSMGYTGGSFLLGGSVLMASTR